MNRARPGRGLPPFLAALACLAACENQGAKSRSGQPPEAAVTVVQPERRSFTRTLRVPGTLEAFQQATLYAKTAGYLSRITVDRGDRVRRGQALAEISVPEMIEERNVAAAHLRQAEAELKLQQITVERLDSIRDAEAGAVTQQQLDESRAKLQVAEATVSRLRADLGRLGALMEYSTIRAPFDGIITDRFVDPGAMIQLATTSAQAPIVTVMNMDTVRVFVEVPEPDVPFVTRSTPARLAVDALPGQLFEGTVTRYSTALDPRTRTMKTEIDFPNPGHRLRPGMYGRVTLDLERREGLAVPASALLVEKDAPYVYTVVDGAAKKTPVKTDFNDGIVVEIVDGLPDGTSVIVGGKGLVTEGMRVRVGSGG